MIGRAASDEWGGVRSLTAAVPTRHAPESVTPHGARHSNHGAMHGTRPRRLPRCVCGHDRQAQRHYRPGSDCGVCSCPRWRRPFLRWFRR